MRPKKINIIQTALFCLSLLLLTGCTSRYAKISIAPGTEKEVFGPTSGTACGLLGISVLPTGQFIPIALLNRYQKAHRLAVERVPRATDLKDVTIQESWYFPLFGVLRCVTVAGVAVR